MLRIGQIADLAIEKWDPMKQAERSQKSARARTERSAIATAGSPTRPKSETLPGTASKIDAAVPATFRVNQKTSRSTHDRVQIAKIPREHIPSAIRHALYLKHNSSCENCGSKKRLQVDHIIAVAMGGKTVLESLRLLCRSCNQRHAINGFGMTRMSQYLKEPIADYAT